MVVVPVPRQGCSRPLMAATQHSGILNIIMLQRLRVLEHIFAIFLMDRISNPLEKGPGRSRGEGSRSGNADWLPSSFVRTVFMTALNLNLVTHHIDGMMVPFFDFDNSAAEVTHMWPQCRGEVGTQLAYFDISHSGLLVSPCSPTGSASRLQSYP